MKKIFVPIVLTLLLAFAGYTKASAAGHYYPSATNLGQAQDVNHNLLPCQKIRVDWHYVDDAGTDTVVASTTAYVPTSTGGCDTKVDNSPRKPGCPDYTKNGDTFITLTGSVKCASEFLSDPSLYSQYVTARNAAMPH